MSSLLPNRSDGYQVTVNFTLSPAVWNAAFGDVALRLDDIEAVVAAGYAAAQEAGTAMAEAIIENAVSDQLDQIGQRIGDYNEQLDLAEDQLAALQQGGVEAINITIPNYGIYENVNAQGAFYELSDYIDSISGALDGPEAFTFSFAGGLTVNWASESDAIGGVNASRPMTPLRTAQAIAALAGDVVKEVFTASGTFTKEDDDFAYFVELWGGGGGGYG
ncbi:hypothetical protein, partial [Pararhizobium haloflavum]|uniref:hypothetical protein n=1 Tax=Pararhizobium haloflavum TaxID=2037914 RepID=UPI0018E4680C